MEGRSLQYQDLFKLIKKIVFGIILARDEKCQLGLHATTHYEWQSMDEKNELILWKLSFIQMNLFNDMVWNLKSIQIQFNTKLSELNSK